MGAIGVVDAELGWWFGAVDIEAALSVVEIDEGAAAGFGDLAERGVDRCLAVTAGGAEDVAG